MVNIGAVQFHRSRIDTFDISASLCLLFRDFSDKLRFYCKIIEIYVRWGSKDSNNLTNA